MPRLVCSTWLGVLSLACSVWALPIHSQSDSGPAVGRPLAAAERRDDAHLSAAPAASDVPEELDRTKMYEYLYSKLGYHKQLGISHAIPLIKGPLSHMFSETSTRNQLHVLDVGCSHGLGVQTLWQHGFCGSGLDISPTAVSMARQHRHPPPGLSCAMPPSFRVGSAGALPWPEASFDAIISTDVLEHVPTKLVPAMVREMTRVTRRALLLKIAMEPEGEVMRHGEKGDQRRGFVGRLKGDVKQAGSLHETVEDSAWWISQFESGGQWSCVDSECLPTKFARKRDVKRGLDTKGRMCASVLMTCTRRRQAAE